MCSFFVCLLLSGVTTASPPAAESVGLPGLRAYRVSATLFRGERVPPDRISELVGLGVETVVSLEPYFDPGPAVTAAGLRYHRVPISAWVPTEEEIVKVLTILTDRTQGVVYVQCRFGVDHSVVLAAAYRRVVQTWTLRETLAELSTPKFGFQARWKDLWSVVRTLRVSEIRGRLGLDVQSTPPNGP
jgi:hypothetical protein